ncbi:MAG: sugar transferase [Bacteroidia bacterium]|nr:sugar transferase [Bacteroidia bacterium]
MENFEIDCKLDNPFYAALKRLFDLCFTLVAFVMILVWLIPLLALLIKLTSKGPVFFLQKRTGYKNKPFVCIKFRSMRLNDEADTKHAIKNDARVTAVGYYLRKFSLDELPQFINVFLGQMSVVGPRPLMIKHTMENEKVLINYQCRHHVKPGITGLSQYKGYRGEMHDYQMLRNRLRLDLFYINHWSFTLDSFIIVKSIKLMLFGDAKAF